MLAGTLAGCGGDGGDGGDGDGGGSDGGEDTPTEEPEDTPTPTEEPEDTPTPTEESMDENGGDDLTHGIDEEFTVGEGDNAVTYRIIEFFRTDRVGSNTNYDEADGTFLIVVLELTNPQSGQIEFPRDAFRLVDSGGAWQRLLTDTTEKVTSDERLDVEPIGNDTFTGESSKVGAVVFDVNPDGTYRLEITPAGGADEPVHIVEVGPISEVQELQGSITN